LGEQVNKARALALLIQEEARHSTQPYYTYNMGGFAASGVRGLFDHLALALSNVTVTTDNSLSSSARYYPSANALALRTVASRYDVVHELVHAVDDFNDWYVNQGGLSTELPEALAYTTEFMLFELAHPSKPNTLAWFTARAYADVAAAQTAWDKAWDRINRVINNPAHTIEYSVVIPRERTVAAADVTDVASKLGFRISASALLPVYNSYLEAQGMPAGALTNSFTFPLNAVFL
jgi:hypothetical protein